MGNPLARSGSSDDRDVRPRVTFAPIQRVLAPDADELAMAQRQILEPNAKRRKMGRPALAESTVPECPLPVSGIVGHLCARGHRCW
eukprot:2631604-Pyramimonas_sp.AAC.1